MKKGFLNGLNFIWQAMLVTGCGLVFMGSTAAYADEDDLVLKGPDNTVFEFISDFFYESVCCDIHRSSRS